MKSYPGSLGWTIVYFVKLLSNVQFLITPLKNNKDEIHFWIFFVVFWNSSVRVVSKL